VSAAFAPKRVSPEKSYSSKQLDLKGKEVRADASSSQTNNDRAGNAGKSRKPVQWDAKEVMGELVASLSQKLEAGRDKRGKRKGGRRTYVVPVESGGPWA
jgi:hypothetical protein